MFSKGNTGSNFEWQMYQGDGNKLVVEWLTLAGSLHLGVTSTNTINSNNWTHTCAKGEVDTDLESFINGTSEGTDTTSSGSMGNGTAEVAISGRDQGAFFFKGDLAFGAIWTVKLSDNHIKSLSNGIPPLVVSGDKPVFNSPVWGNVSPEPNYSKTTNGTLTSAPGKATTNPPVELIENYL